MVEVLHEFCRWEFVENDERVQTCSRRVLKKDPLCHNFIFRQNDEKKIHVFLFLIFENWFCYFLEWK